MKNQLCHKMIGWLYSLVVVSKQVLVRWTKLGLLETQSVYSWPRLARRFLTMLFVRKRTMWLTRPPREMVRSHRLWKLRLFITLWMEMWISMPTIRILKWLTMLWISMCQTKIIKRRSILCMQRLETVINRHRRWRWTLTISWVTSFWKCSRVKDLHKKTWLRWRLRWKSRTRQVPIILLTD